MGILVSSFDFSPVAEDEFHDWYDTEHIPERERVPGFLSCRRWMSVEDARVSMTTYDLASVDVLRSPGYLAIGYENNSPWTRRVGWRCIKRLRFEGEQVDPGPLLPPEAAGGLLVRAVNVVPDHEATFERWQQEALLPALRTVPGVMCARRFEATRSTHRHVLICHLQQPDVVAGDAWARAVAMPAAIGPGVAAQLDTLCRRYQRGA